MQIFASSTRRTKPHASASIGNEWPLAPGGYMKKNMPVTGINDINPLFRALFMPIQIYYQYKLTTQIDFCGISWNRCVMFCICQKFCLAIGNWKKLSLHFFLLICKLEQNKFYNATLKISNIEMERELKLFWQYIFAGYYCKPCPSYPSSCRNILDKGITKEWNSWSSCHPSPFTYTPTTNMVPRTMKWNNPHLKCMEDNRS